MPTDTLAIARDLRQHGFTQEQAEALTDAVRILTVATRIEMRDILSRLVEAMKSSDEPEIKIAVAAAEQYLSKYEQK